MSVILWVRDNANGAINLVGPFDGAQLAQNYAEKRWPPHFWQIHALNAPDSEP